MPFISELEVIERGVVPYAAALEEQREAAKERITGVREHDVLFLLEHPPVITLGRSAGTTHVVAAPAQLARRGVEVVEVERGGDVTFHGPGQIVGYPVLDLKRPPHRQDLHWYLRSIEQALIDVLGEFGIEAGRREKLTGVWVGQRKIASIGVHARDWVTWHGFALNVTTDLSYFDLIVPCGIAGVEMTLMARELAPATVDLAEVRHAVAESFAATFALTPLAPLSLRARGEGFSYSEGTRGFAPGPQTTTALTGERPL